MMKYYRIYYSVNEKEIGYFPQLHEARKLDYDENNNLTNRTFLDMPSKNASVPYGVLQKKGKKTDLMSGIFSLGGFFVSKKFKELIENSKHQGVCFCATSLVAKGLEDFNYWILSPHISELNFINWQESIFEYATSSGAIIFDNIQFKNKAEFSEAFKEAKNLPYNQTAKFLERVYLRAKFLCFVANCGLDFFSFSPVKPAGIHFYASEKLKADIEQAGCTGIRFSEINDKF
jgi:hypothetical protein